MKLYVLLDEIDLGDRVLGVFDSIALVDKALDEATKIYQVKHPGVKHTFFIEEYDLNKLTCY